MTSARLVLLNLANTEPSPMPVPAERRQPATLERLVSRLAREVDACPVEGTLPAEEVRALLSLLETQARHLQALAQGVSHG